MTEDHKDQEEVLDPTVEAAEATEETTVEQEQEAAAEAHISPEDIDPASIEDLEGAMAALTKVHLAWKKTRDELKAQSDINLRLQADFVNFRKRKEKEVTDSKRFANQDLLTKLLPILDNFDRTLDAIEKTDNLTAVKEGITLVDTNLRKTLAKIGLEPIETKGKPFDSEIHEAITSIPVEDEAQKGNIVDEVEKGYKLKDRVIRFSKVIVGE